MPRFVILEHDHPFRHWDLMLEAGPALRTWRLLVPPAPDVAIEAEGLADHRPDYLDYEGPVSGGRGRVERWDAGSFDFVSVTADVLELRLAGSRHAGTARLVRTAGDRWEFRLHAPQRDADLAGG